MADSTRPPDPPAGPRKGQPQAAPPDPEHEPPRRASTGIAGLDAILGGGLQRHHTYLIEGIPGAGKTTLGLHFCMAGARAGERVLFLTTSESEEEIREVARSHGWSLDGVTIHYHDAQETWGAQPEQSVFRPAEVELPRTMQTLLAAIDRVDPQRLVIDSLTEIRLVATDPLWYRRQVLLLKDDLAGRRCTTLLCDRPQDPHPPVQTIAHGVINLEHHTPEYGPDRRRLRIAKLRGQAYASGYHDFKILTGGIELYPRLIAAEHRQGFQPESIPSGLPALDALFGGGADRGTATLLLGPSGTGKSSIACQYAAAAAGRGEPSSLYLFDERAQTVLGRMQSLGTDLAAPIDRGLINLHQIDPAEVTPDEFSHRIRRDVTERGARLVVIDSLTGYFHAMPHEQLLTLHLHELLSYLSQVGASVLLVMTQHGLPGAPRHTPIDLSYVADSVLLFHLFEHAGALCKAISVYKRRGGPHERTIRELQFGPDGMRVGHVLRGFRGILTGIPSYTGAAIPDGQDDDPTAPRTDG